MHKDDMTKPLYLNLDDIETAPPININDLLSPHITKAPLYSPISDRHNKALQDQNQTIVNFFKHIVTDETKVNTVVGNILDDLNETELDTFSKYLKTIKLEKITPKYDVVTPESIIMMEHFVNTIKKRDLTVFEGLKDTNVDLFQELRLAFNTGKILKNKLAVYFNTLHSLHVSSKMMMRHLRAIDPKLFSDNNLRNKKKPEAVYLLNSRV